MKRNAGLFDIYRLRRCYPVVLALPRISHHPRRLWQQPPQHQEVSDVYALAYRLAGSCSIPWRVDAERADLRLGRRGISIWVDGRRWRGVRRCGAVARGSVECHPTVSLEIPEAARPLAPEPFWKPTSTSDFDAGGAARALQNGLQIAEWSAKIHQSFQCLAA